MATKFSKETYLYWYELMQLIRQFELKAEEMYKMAGKIRGFFHAYVGQEAIAAGCMTATGADDPFITAYRDHGLGLAKGMSANACMAELYGKATGCSKGKGGSMHFFSLEHRFFGGHGIVGAQIGTGAGLAFAEKYKGTQNVVLCFFGDGAARQGILHETFNLAMLWKLPVIFICENNNYAMGTSIERTSNVVDIYKLADAYDMPADMVDGMTPETVHESVSRAEEVHAEPVPLVKCQNHQRNLQPSCRLQVSVFTGGLRKSGVGSLELGVGKPAFITPNSKLQTPNS